MTMLYLWINELTALQISCFDSLNRKRIRYTWCFKHTITNDNFESNCVKILSCALNERTTGSFGVYMSNHLYRSLFFCWDMLWINCINSLFFFVYHPNINSLIFVCKWFRKIMINMWQPRKGEINQNDILIK